MDPRRSLEIDDLTVHFKTDEGLVEAVDGLTFHVDQGEVVALVGESGSGKSVTGLSVMRLFPSPPGYLVRGAIRFRGKDGQVHDLAKLSESRMRRIRGNDIAMVFQEPMTSLNPVYTIGDQITEAITLHQGKGRREARRMAIEMLDLVEIPGASKRVDDYPHQLSGGMRQRVMIAMALSCRPSLLIADEPTTALDVIIQAQILDLLKRLQSETGASVLFITHDLGVVAEMANRVVVMQKGRKVEEARTPELFATPAEPYTQRLIAAVPRIDLTKPAPRAAEKAPVLVELRNLQVHFPIRGGVLNRPIAFVKAVDGVSLSIRKGETLGLVGESGSGKTTLGRALLRLIEPTGGTVGYDGKDITHVSQSELRKLRRRIQVVFQDPYGSLNPRMTVNDTLAEPLLVHGLFRRGPALRKRVAELLEMVDLEPRMASRYPHEFSGGQRQRVAIARALALEPDFIVADECVSALDVSIQADVLKLLRRLRSELDLTLLFISHDLAVVEELADRVAVMYKGKLVELADSHTLYRHPQDDYTKALLSAVPIPDPQVKRQRIHWDPESYSPPGEVRAGFGAL